MHRAPGALAEARERAQHVVRPLVRRVEPGVLVARRGVVRRRAPRVADYGTHVVKRDGLRERARARRVRAKTAEAREGSVGSGASRESETGKARATDDVRAVMEEGPDGVLGEYVIGCARVRWEEGKAEEATSVS